MRQKNYLDLSRWSFRFALACATEIKIPLGKSTKLKHNLWFTTTKHFAARCGGDVAAAKDDRNLSQDKVAVVVVYVMLFRRIVVVFALVVAVVGRPFVWFNRVRSPLGMVRRRVQCRSTRCAATVHHNAEDMHVQRETLVGALFSNNSYALLYRLSNAEFFFVVLLKPISPTASFRLRWWNGWKKWST